MQVKIASFFGGGSGGCVNSPEYLESTSIGQCLARHGYEVRNGGYRGLMEAVSKGVSVADGKCVGYTCKSFGYTKGNSYLSETVVSADIYDRLRHLIDYSNVLVVHRGSVGTFAELFLAIDVNRKKQFPAKIILYGEFWSEMSEHLRSLLGDDLHSQLSIINSIADLEAILASIE